MVRIRFFHSDGHTSLDSRQKRNLAIPRPYSNDVKEYHSHQKDRCHAGPYEHRDCVGNQDMCFELGSLDGTGAKGRPGKIKGMTVTIRR